MASRYASLLEVTVGSLELGVLNIFATDYGIRRILTSISTFVVPSSSFVVSFNPFHPLIRG
jgi:hypothetical protein